MTAAPGASTSQPRRPSRRQIVDDAVAELATRDAGFAWVAGHAGRCALGARRQRVDPFGELARMIVFQQLAGAAARTIFGRFAAAIPGGLTPEGVLAADDATLRGAGLSGQKAASVRDLALHVLDGSLPLDRLARQTDDDVVRELTEVRGIGRWTAEMFLIFRLGRLDVWPVDDLGVRRGYARMQGLSEMPKPRDLEPLGDGYRPHRSIVAWYCWHAADTVLPEPGESG